jgi:hypothetical protein
VIDGFTAWRSITGVSYSGVFSTSNLSLNNLTLFGHSAAAINLSGGDGLTITGSSVIAGDTTFSCPRGIFLNSIQSLIEFNISSLDMSGVGGIYAPCTSSDIEWFTSSSTPIIAVRGKILNSKFGAPSTLLNAPGQWLNDSYLGFEKYNQTAGDHRTQMKFGVLKTDTSVFNVASPSMLMTPNSATFKLESAPKGKGLLVAVANGGTVTTSVYVRKSASYNGNQPRLGVRTNPALGITVDTILATYSAGTGSWNQMVGTTAAVSDDGVLEFFIDCDGTAGAINVDDWSQSALKYWFVGLPIVDPTSGGGGGSGFGVIGG